MNSNTSYLSVRGVGKKFVSSSGETHVAVGSVDLDIGEHEFVSIIGHSGCGKSTILRMIAGLEPCEQGRIELDGKPVQSPSAERGLVFQEYALFPWRNVRENVGFGLELRGVPKAELDSTPRQLSEFKGKVIVVVFGFTHCPDVCPTTLYELSLSMKQLEEQSKDVQVIFVTLDPHRDTNKILSKYVTAFHPTFIALRGSARETVSAVRDFRVFFKKVPGKTAQTYSIDHSVGVYLFDRTGKPRIYARSAEAKTLVPDLKRLLSEKVPG